MRIFLSKQVINLRTILVLLQKNEWLWNSPDLKQ